MLILAAIQGLLHLHLVNFAYDLIWGEHPAKKIASEEVNQFRAPGMPWRILGRAPPTPPDFDEEYNYDDNITCRSAS